VVADEMLVVGPEAGHPVVPATGERCVERVRRDLAPDPDLGLDRRHEDQPGPSRAGPDHAHAAARRANGDAHRATPATRRPTERPRDEWATASSAARSALAQAISDRQPGAATMSPATNTPSPRSTAGRSRHERPG